ncbi:MAG: hypothetical protein Kow0031_17360 [Anaerolineae bacterium]
MVVTDLHGDWDAYRRYRDRFVQLHARGQADWLIFTGDLIHAEKPAHDRSVDMVLDLLALRQTYGDAIIYLCGNHEMPHIYSISLAKGERVYTPDFEKAMAASDHRAEIIELFTSLPFYIRTRAGVSITHAGAAALFADAANAERIFNWDHKTLLDWSEAAIAGEDLAELRIGYARQHNNVPYHLLAQYFLAVSGPDDPRFNDLLRGFVASSHPWFDDLLWPALFTRNEEDYGAGDYAIFLDALLQELSRDFAPQQVLVAGHMTIMGGYKIVANRHLRLASSRHAQPRKNGLYLLFDAARPVAGVEELLRGLGTVFD